MSEVPGDLKYMASHEWARTEDDGLVRIGISDHAQSLLGDLVYVELPEVGDAVERDAGVAVVESVKAASDVYAPLDGEVVAINEALAEAPEVVNESPYENGWLYLLKPADTTQLDLLLDPAAYEATLSDD